MRLIVIQLVIRLIKSILFRITNEEVKRRCGVEDLEHRLRKLAKLRWFDHVKRNDKKSILRRTMELDVEGGVM